MFGERLSPVSAAAGAASRICSRKNLTESALAFPSFFSYDDSTDAAVI